MIFKLFNSRLNFIYFLKNLSVQNIFLVFAIFFGLLYAIATPPFQVADEISHFYRAYQISEGRFTAVRSDNRLGGYIPESLVLFSDQYKKFIMNPHCKLRCTYLKKSAEIELQPQKIVFADFPYTALYSPVSYLPQSISIFFLRIFKCKPFYLLYISRLVTLFFWITIVYITIKIVPVQKYLLTFLALLPMSIASSSSLSADVVTNSLSFFLIGYILNVAFSNKSFTKKDFVIISIVIIGLGLAKLLYVVLILIFLVIPISKFKSIKYFALVFVSITMLGFGSSLLWANNIKRIYLPVSNYNTDYKEKALLHSDADMTKQIEFIKKSNKSHLIKIFFKSYMNEFDGMTSGYIGELGWGDTELPKWFIVLGYIIIFALAIGTNNKKISFQLSKRLLFIFISLLLTVLIMLSQYLSFDSVGSNLISPLQGRYFIPVFPLIFIVFYNTKFVITHKYLNFIFSILIFLPGLFAFSVLFNRFYYNYDIEKKWELISDPDQFKNNKEIYIINNKDTIAIRSAIQPCIEKAHSGFYSQKLTSKNQFGFTTRIYKVRKGDMVKISFWRLGDAGYIVINEFKNGGFYYSLLQEVKREHSGWKYFESEFFIPKDLVNEELRIFIWNTKTDSAYFDDFKTSFYKRKQI